MLSTATLGWLTTAHWNGHANSSPSFPLLEGNQIVLDYVPAGIKVSIEGVTTMFADKVRLVNSVRTRNVSAFTTLLRGISCIYIDHSYSLCLCFILYKVLKLSKVPTLQPASVLLVNLNPFPNPFELFKDDYSTSKNKVNYFPSYLMVNASSKPFLLLRKFLEVSLSRRSVFGLQSFAKCTIPFRNNSYVSTVKKPVNLSVRSRYNSKFTKPQVNSNVEVGRFYIGEFLFNSSIEEELFKSLIILEVSRGKFPIEIPLEVVRNLYLKLQSSLNSSKGNFLPIKPDGIGTLVIADSRVVAFRTPAFKSFPFPFDSRLEIFSSNNPCRDYKLRREGKFLSQRVVGEFVEFNSIPEFIFPTNFTGVIISKLILFNSFKEYLLLLFGRFKDKFKSPLQFHIHILQQYLLKFKCGLLPYYRRISDCKDIR